MHQAVELFAGICFLVIGLSHLVQPMAWVDFFAELRARGKAGAFLEGFLCLAFGAIIAGFHNIWSGLPAVLTVVGWVQILKGLIRFTAPGLVLRIYERMKPERAWLFHVAGIFSIVLGGLFTYMAFRL